MAKNLLKDYRIAGDIIDQVSRTQAAPQEQTAPPASNSGGPSPESRPQDGADPGPPAGIEDLGGGSRLLDAVTEFYARELASHPAAQSWLKARGLWNVEVLGRLKAGYAAGGDLAPLLSESQRAKLTEAGLFTADGGEALAGCLVVPLADEAGQSVAFCGLLLEDGAKIRERYVGTPRGLVNRAALSVWRDEILLTEDLTSALALLAQGVQNAVPCWGKDGFTAEHLEGLQRAGVKKIALNFFSPGLAAKLTGEGFLVVQRDREPPKTPPPVSGPGYQVKKESPGVWAFSFGEMGYRVMGVKEIFTQDLKVSIRAQKDGGVYYDRVDLYGAKSRGGFAASVGGVLGLEPKRVEKDLVAVLEHFEGEREKALRGDQDQPIVLTPEEAAIGMSFLTSRDLMEQVVADMEALGYAGEEVNKKLVYLTAVSRFLDKPLSVYIQAGSGAGKSYLLDTLRKLLPREAVKAVTSFSDQALNYLEGEELVGKVFMIGEAVHNEVVEAQIRQMQSEGETARLVTTKDPKSGEMKSREVRQKVRMSFMMSSTALDLNPENASRCLILQVDESSAQTERILSAQRQRRTSEGMGNTAGLPQIIQKHLCAQRLLEALVVVNEYAPHLSYPKARASMRRSQEQFLTLLDAVCLLRQKQKPRIVVGDKQAVACDLEDYRIAYEVFQKGIWRGYGGQEIPGGSVLVYEAVRAQVGKLAQAQKMEVKEITFTQRLVREWTGLGQEFLKKHLRLLVEFEYLVIAGGRHHGARWSYRLREDAGVGELDGKMMPTPEQLAVTLGLAREG